MRSRAQERAARISIALLALGGCLSSPSDPPRELGTVAALSAPHRESFDPIAGQRTDRKDPIHFDARLEQAVWESSAARGPLARTAHAMAFDGARSRSVLFGGESDAAQLADTWEWDGAAWARRCSDATCAANVPAARSGHAMAYDRARGVTVLFGGQGADALRSDTWTWNGVTWRDACAGGACGSSTPAPRFGHAMAYDSVRGRVVLFGGAACNATVCSDFGDTWEWDGARWILASNGGPARSGHGMMFDGARSLIVVFGGAHTGLLGDTWTWSGAEWKQAPTPSGPPPRASAALAYDGARRRGALFGGDAVGSGTWDWDGASWTSLATTGDPGERNSFAMVYDETRRRVVLFGGHGNGRALDDTWEQRRIGGVCGDAAECDTGLCLDGTCCTSVCGPCASCSAGEAGICEPVSNADDQDSCTGDRTCDARSLCLLKDGRPCQARDECASGFCVDGLCCATACTDRCQTCRASLKTEGADGTCGAVAKGGDPHDDCADDGACSCQRTGACDGSGACELYTRGTDCAHCGSRDPAFAAVCDGFGVCAAAVQARCVAGHLLAFADGHQHDCAPYRCTPEATCLETCTSGDDCSQGQTCSARRVCVPQQAPRVLPEPTCALRAGARSSASASWLVAGSIGPMLLLLMRRLMRRGGARRTPATRCPSEQPVAARSSWGSP